MLEKVEKLFTDAKAAIALGAQFDFESGKAEASVGRIADLLGASKIAGNSDATVVAQAVARLAATEQAWESLKAAGLKASAQLPQPYAHKLVDYQARCLAGRGLVLEHARLEGEGRSQTEDGRKLRAALTTLSVEVLADVCSELGRVSGFGQKITTALDWAHKPLKESLNYPLAG
jgi:hypothetical protein